MINSSSILQLQKTNFLLESTQISSVMQQSHAIRLHSLGIILLVWIVIVTKELLFESTPLWFENG